jgi:hypothetical protein
MISSLENVLLATGPAEADAAWRAWRADLVLDELDWTDAQLLPLLPQTRLEVWLGDDPAMGRLLGLVRRAWSEAQFQLHHLQDVVAQLNAGGAGPLMIAGPAALHIRNAHPGSIRPIGELQLVLPRERLGAAAALLRQMGWSAATPAPLPRAMNWVDQWVWRKAGRSLRLLWRATPVVPWRAREYEAELWTRSEAVLPTEHLLVSRLAGGGGWHGPIPWRVDAALLALTEGEWAAAARYAARDAPVAFARIQELRSGVGQPGPVRFVRVERSIHRGLVLLRANLLRILRQDLT